jgi:hypothetical protein
MNRVNAIMGHLAVSSDRKDSISPLGASGSGSGDDVVIVSALRTAIGRAKKGSFKDTHPADLLAGAIKGVLAATNIDPKAIDEVCVGNVLAPGGFAMQARMASFMAGIPETTSVSTCNRQCSSGLQAVAHIAGAIQAGYIDVGMASGVESMSLTPMGPASVGDLSPNAFEVQKAADCLTPMGVTSENVAEKVHSCTLSLPLLLFFAPFHPGAHTADHGASVVFFSFLPSLCNSCAVPCACAVWRHAGRAGCHGRRVAQAGTARTIQRLLLQGDRAAGDHYHGQGGQ